MKTAAIRLHETRFTAAAGGIHLRFRRDGESSALGDESGTLRIAKSKTRFDMRAEPD
jgi:hypothetical protein